jgi:hypothetical protein
MKKLPTTLTEGQAVPHVQKAGTGEEKKVSQCRRCSRPNLQARRRRPREARLRLRSSAGRQWVG